VLTSPDPLFPGEPDAGQFDDMLGWICSWFDVLPLDEAIQRLARGALPARAAAITFDDGYADNHGVALPILRRRGVTATFFIATGYLDGGCMWNDRIIAAIRHCPRSSLELDDLGLGNHALTSMADMRGAIQVLLNRAKYLPGAEREDLAKRITDVANVPPPKDLMLTTSQVRALRADGMQIGAHTVSHPILARECRENARREVIESKTSLEEVLREPVSLFAYPNGKPGVDYLHEHVALVRDAGFAAAVSTSWGAADRNADFMQLPRFTPWDRTAGRFGLRLLTNLFRKSVAA
jgi:peptidoglycan/xylan/chitin deacetylase (PgdA/CDA1 family)